MFRRLFPVRRLLYMIIAFSLLATFYWILTQHSTRQAGVTSSWEDPWTSTRDWDSGVIDDEVYAHSPLLSAELLAVHNLEDHPDIPSGGSASSEDIPKPIISGSSASSEDIPKPIISGSSASSEDIPKPIISGSSASSEDIPKPIISGSSASSEYIPKPSTRQPTAGTETKPQQRNSLGQIIISKNGEIVYPTEINRESTNHPQPPHYGPDTGQNKLFYYSNHGRGEAPTQNQTNTQHKLTPYSTSKQVAADGPSDIAAEVARAQYGVISPELLNLPQKDRAASMALQHGRKQALDYLTRYLQLASTWNKRSHPTMEEINFTGAAVSPNKARRILVVSTWRSGSTFLGQLVSSHPLAFYSFEPLKPFDNDDKSRQQLLQLTPVGSPLTSEVIRGALNCDFSSLLRAPDLGSYVDNFLLPHAPVVRRACASFPRVCHDMSYLQTACGLYPIRVVKTVRALLATDIAPLMHQDPDLKVIYLVRDPRGSYSSRLHTDWCSYRCNSTETLCSDLQHNLHAAEALQHRNPDNLLVVKYEDLADDVVGMTQEIFGFMELPVEDTTLEFLKQHTGQEDSLRQAFGSRVKPWHPKQEELNKWRADPHGTFRDTKKSATLWRKNLSFSVVLDVQNKCGNVLNLIHHRIFRNEAELRNDSIPLSKS